MSEDFQKFLEINSKFFTPSDQDKNKVKTDPKISRVGILGGAGYTGGELIRLLLNHPAAQLAFVQSRSQAGKPVSSVHTDLRGTTELSFIERADGQAFESIDVLFLALPHGESRKFLAENPLPESLRIIDLSNDFRLGRESTCGTRTFTYGLPEADREQICSSLSVANPGCFASAIQFALLPLAKNGLLQPVAITGITGSTGAGQKPSETTHFSFRANNIQPYKTLSHQHVPEIEETLGRVQGRSAEGMISFIPWRGDFTRGIFISAQTSCPRSLRDVETLYRDYYRSHPFIHISVDPIDLKSVVNTNRVLIGLEKTNETLAVHCSIDNLLKGASGQAVQNFNLMMGYPETLGLQLKGTAF
jgi:N-acetyl-gamma-glutamyl-phosphate reductase